MAEVPFGIPIEIFIVGNCLSECHRSPWQFRNGRHDSSIAKTERSRHCGGLLTDRGCGSFIPNVVRVFSCRSSIDPTPKHPKRSRVCRSILPAFAFISNSLDCRSLLCSLCVDQLIDSLASSFRSSASRLVGPSHTHTQSRAAFQLTVSRNQSFRR